MTAAERAARFCSVMACEWSSDAGNPAEAYTSGRYVFGLTGTESGRLVAAAVGLMSEQRSDRSDWLNGAEDERWAYAESLIRNGEVR